MSLSFVNFRVSRFSVSHLTHETVKLCLQNTLNMSKMTRVYFRALQAIEMKMFILLIFQNKKAIIDVFLACMMRVGCGIGDWDM